METDKTDCKKCEFDGVECLVCTFVERDDNPENYVRTRISEIYGCGHMPSLNLD